MPSPWGRRVSNQSPAGIRVALKRTEYCPAASSTDHEPPVPVGLGRYVALVDEQGILAMTKAARRGRGRGGAAFDLLPHVPGDRDRITAYLSNGGTLEHGQQIAGHASPKTTKLYDRTADTVTVDEIERIVI